MLAIVPPGKEPGFLFKEVFLRQLPAEVQSLVTQQDYPTLRDLAKAADKHFMSTGATINATMKGGKHNKREGPRHQHSKTPDPDLCWYHQKFGKQATKCTTPCKFSEN